VVGVCVCRGKGESKNIRCVVCVFVFFVCVCVVNDNVCVCVYDRHDVPPGTYVLEVTTVDFKFDAVYIIYRCVCVYVCMHVTLSHTNICCVCVCLCVYTQIRLDISARNKGRVKASRLPSRRSVPYPLNLRPSTKADYFQVFLS